MEKFKNALKSVNKFGLGAIVIIAVTMMSFKTIENKQVNVKWAWNGTEWINIDGQNQQVLPNGPGDYLCDDFEETCTAEFDESITDPNSPEAPEPSNVIEGRYQDL